MNDQEYIRKAVELADGFEKIENDVKFHHEWYMNFKLHQYLLDALAAQLVRQVDLFSSFAFDSDDYGTAKVWERSISKANDEDRTMNTIRAIVDSEVLS